MRGAAFLARSSGVQSKQTDLDNALVIDVGGTSTDVGQLVNGFPRKAPSKVEVLETSQLK